VKNATRGIQFTGFRDTAGVRQFAFDLVAEDRSRSTLLVSADMKLARKYDIRLQELPLLCRHLLDDPQLNDPQLNDQREPIALTEQHMVAIRDAVQTATDKKRRKAPAAASNTEELSR